VPEAGYDIIGLPVAGFQRKISLKNITFFIKLIKSMRRSASIIKKFKPDIAVGVGGYASGPILRAASAKGISIVIQEQNSYAGVTNRLLAGKAKKIFVAYEGMEKYFPAERIILTGNPIRQDIFGKVTDRKDAVRFFGLDPDKRCILILGGSLGARTINQAVEKNLDELGGNVQLIWQSGKIYYDDIKERLKNYDMKGITLLPFIKDMNMAFAAADIIVSRAGAGTISELAVAGKPVVLVPSPNVSEDHQTKNTMALVNRNAAIHVADKNAEKDLISICLDLSENIVRMKELSDNIKKIAIPDSAERIAREILSIE
jgi:UDP-N-acetylglucosamine--N-acetylmuramyl-(pentapeptide) pyrophosphoryl-undecaprenol N-acetylglucosamine transferase